MASVSSSTEVKPAAKPRKFKRLRELPGGKPLGRKVARKLYRELHEGMLGDDS